MKYFNVFTCFLKHYSVWVETLWCGVVLCYAAPEMLQCWIPDLLYELIEGARPDLNIMVTKRLLLYQPPRVTSVISGNKVSAKHHVKGRTMQYMCVKVSAGPLSPSISPSDHGSPRTRTTAADADRERALPTPGAGRTLQARVWARALGHLGLGRLLLVDAQSHWSLKPWQLGTWGMMRWPSLTPPPVTHVGDITRVFRHGWGRTARQPCPSICLLRAPTEQYGCSLH